MQARGLHCIIIYYIIYVYIISCTLYYVISYGHLRLPKGPQLRQHGGRHAGAQPALYYIILYYMIVNYVFAPLLGQHRGSHAGATPYIYVVYIMYILHIILCKRYGHLRCPQDGVILLYYIILYYIILYIGNPF